MSHPVRLGDKTSHGGAVLATASHTDFRGQPLACVEAMKMEMWLPAAGAGTVKAVHRALKAAVAAGDLIIELDLDE